MRRGGERYYAALQEKIASSVEKRGKNVLIDNSMSFGGTK